MTGYSVTFRQEPKHDLTGAWSDAPLFVPAKAQASGPCQTSQTQSSLPRSSESDHVPHRAERGGNAASRALLIPFTANYEGRWKQTNVDRRFLGNVLKEHLLLRGLRLPPRAEELMDNNRPGRLPEIKVARAGTGFVSVFP